MKPLSQIRRERLKALVPGYGKPADLARHLDKDRRQISHWLTGHKSISDESAREIERACVKPSGWLDHEADAALKAQEETHIGSQSVRTDRSKMADAIRLLQELSELQGLPGLVSDPVAISIAYDFLVEFDTPLSESNVLDITKRLAAKIRGDANVTPERSSAA